MLITIIKESGLPEFTKHGRFFLIYGLIANTSNGELTVSDTTIQLYTKARNVPETSSDGPVV